MATIITRAGKGSALTNTEADDNFTNLNNEKLTFIVSGISSSATPTPASTDDQYNITALAVNATFAAPSGSPVNGRKLLIRIRDNGTARTLGWNAIYRVVGVTLPTTTVVNKTIYVGVTYNSTDVKWDVVAIAQEA